MFLWKDTESSWSTTGSTTGLRNDACDQFAKEVNTWSHGLPSNGWGTSMGSGSSFNDLLLWCDIHEPSAVESCVSVSVPKTDQSVSSFPLSGPSYSTLKDQPVSHDAQSNTELPTRSAVSEPSSPTVPRSSEISMESKGSLSNYVLHKGNV